MPKRDMAKASAVAGLAEWMRKGSGALMVVVIRVDDLAIAADPQLAPRDTVTLLEDRMPEIHAQLQAARAERQAKLDRQREKSLRR